MELTDILLDIYPLPADSLARLAAIADETVVARNTVIIESGHLGRYLYFIGKGIVRAFVEAEGKEITFWIGAEGSVALSMESYVNDRPGYESIEALEPCLLYRLSVGSLRELYAEDIHIANWGRKFAEREIIRAEKCLIPRLFTTASTRYEEFVRTNPGLLNRIPLKHLATYLGVTPVSLSRIRASITRK